MEPEALLRQLRVSDNIYYVGSFQPPITFLSQQNRALNFVWALQQSGFAIEDSSICIIGAGLGGLTVASALRVLKAKVTVLERASDLLPLQQGNSSRFVLPHLFEWPTVGSAYPRTHLPFLNWTAGSAGAIVADLISQWNRLGLQPEYAVKVQRVTRIADQPTVIFKDRTSRTFELIVIAAGFGVENGHLARHTPHYWRNDDFDQPVIKDDVFSCLVSGTGDGGLIDALRVTTRNFRHGDFLSWLVNHIWIQGQARAIRDRLAAGDNQTNVWQDFLNTDLPGEIEQYLRESHRPRTNVTLLGRGRTPMSGRGLLSNQIAVAMFWKLGLISYRQGNLTNVEKRSRETFRARIAEVGNEQNAETLSFDRVIARVGPTNVLRPLIGKARFDTMSAAWPDSIADETPIPQYNPVYLKDAFMTANQETSYEVLFALGTFADSGQPVTPGSLSTVIEPLNVLGNQLGINNLGRQFSANGTNFNSFVSDEIWNGLPCRFEVVDGLVQTDRGSCAWPMIRVQTKFRAVLDTLLRNDPLRYHSFTIGVTPDVIAAGHLEPGRDLETNVFVQDQRAANGTLRVVSHMGMFQAHRLFSVQDLVSILRNQWVTNRIHSLGWLIATPALHLREHWTI